MAKIVDLTKKWGYNTVFDNFSLEIEDKKVTAILGKSGVGKTTLLNAVAGLIDYEGKIGGFGKVSYVFQEHRLIPFMTVHENLEYVLTDSVKDKNAINGLIDEVLKITKLSSLENKLVDKLSGGEKQRVSLARAFCYPADTVLMDEPFNSLDVGLKRSIMIDFKNLIEAFGRTCVFVTHSVDEALFLSDTVVYLDKNRVEKLPPVCKDRSFGFEKDDALRKKLYSLLFD